MIETLGHSVDGTASSSAAAALPLAIGDARSVLGGLLDPPMAVEPFDPDPAVVDTLLGLNGCLTVERPGPGLGGSGRMTVLLADRPTPDALHAVAARLGGDFDWILAATPVVFAESFARARAMRAVTQGFVERVLDVALSLGASDVKVAPGDLPGVKIAGASWKRLGEFPPVTPEQASQLAAWAAQRDPGDMGGGPFDLDVAMAFRGVRMRANVYRTMGGWGTSLRVLPDAVPPIETLHLPEVVVQLCSLERGLVFVSGPTGSGKTTTLAAMLDRINRTRPVAISTMELPVEYVHRPRRALIHAREVGSDTVSFSRAIDSALRQNPDVVLVGELRNPEEYLAAIRLARTGHLVFATLHAESAEEAVRGVVHSFPEGDQHLVRTELAATLRAVVVQMLVPSSEDPRRPTVVCEVLIRTPAVAAIISRAAFAQLPGEIRNGRQHGMCSMDDALSDAVATGRITPGAAARYGRDPSAASRRLRATP